SLSDLFPFPYTDGDGGEAGWSSRGSLIHSPGFITVLILFSQVVYFFFMLPAVVSNGVVCCIALFCVLMALQQVALINKH
ncbi:MAG TPA: hypothetical protein VEY10_10790, partial [Flavisolibacter sp.]|nr:hypothetical protein [Flavisolibacter sp.]